MEDLITLLRDANAKQMAIITIFARGLIRGKQEPGK